MIGKQVETWPRQDFPPWSAKTLLLWILGFMIISTFVGLPMITILVNTIVLLFALELTTQDIVGIILFTGRVTYPISVSLFILWRLHERRFTSRDVWFQYKANPNHILVCILLGVLLPLLTAVSRKLLVGEVGVPSILQKSVDGRLAMASDIIVFGGLSALAEEILFRGLLFQAVRRHYSCWVASFLASTTFTIYHLDNWGSCIHLISTFVFGLVAAFVFDRTRSLSNCMALHVSANTTVAVIHHVSYFITKL